MADTRITLPGAGLRARHEQTQRSYQAASPVQAIRCRSDLSFTNRENASGFLDNWSVPCAQHGNWHDAVLNGQRLFNEVETLATADELQAFEAIVFALNSENWRGSCHGTEVGFSQPLAALAIVGMRALRAGANRFDFEAEGLRRLNDENCAGTEQQLGEVHE